MAALVRHGFRRPLTAWDLPFLRRALDDTGVRIVLLDMATRESPSLLRAAMDINPELRAVAVAVSGDDEVKVVECEEAGVLGYHLRSDSLQELIALIRAVASGTSSKPPTIAAILQRQLSTLASAPSREDKEPVLTPREHQILRLLELGRSNRAIAAEVGIAVPTVKNHVHNVLSKLGVGTRAEAAATSRAMRVRRGFNR